MIPTLIVLGLLAVGVTIVALATRNKGPASAAPPVDPETGWDDPITPANSPARPDPFAHAPASERATPDPVRTTEPHA